MPNVLLFPEGSSPSSAAELMVLRITDPSGETVYEEGVPANQWAEVALEPGAYVARVTPPSGRSGQLRFSVPAQAPEDFRVFLKAPRSLHEWLGTPTDRGTVLPGSQYRRVRAESAGRGRRPDIWMRMWQRRPILPAEDPFSDQSFWDDLLALWAENARQKEEEESEGVGLLPKFTLPAKRLPPTPEPPFRLTEDFQVGPWPDAIAHYDEDVWHFAFQPRDGAQNVAQFGGRNAPWRMMVLPPSRVELVLHTSEALEASGRGFRASLAPDEMGNPAESVLSFFANGAMASGRVAGEAYLHRHRSLIRSDPVAGAVAGLYLLRIRDLKRLEAEWPRTLADEFWWIPDLHVVQGWIHLLQPTPRTAEARKSLSRAAAVGLPIFTHALKLLVDGLEILQEWEPGGEHKQALWVVGPVADAADWSQVFTTFYGHSPERATPSPSSGVPVDPKYLHFLPEGRESGIPFPDLPDGVPTRPLIQVLPDPKGWRVNVEGIHAHPYETKWAALDFAIETARGQTPSRLVVHRKDGATQAIRAYGSMKIRGR